MMIHQQFSRCGAILPLVFATLAFAITGCARVSVLSVVQPDGSLQRTMTYHGSAAPAPGAVSMMPGTSLNDLIIVPTKAGGWAVNRSHDTARNEDEVVATKSIAVGYVEKDDLGVRDSGAAAGAPRLLIANNLDVRETVPGTIVYHETLHWLGKPDEGFGKEPAAETLQALRAGLPAVASADTVSLRKAAIEMQKKLWLILVGPNDPVLPIMMFHPDFAEYRLRQQLTGVVDQTLTDVYGTRLTDADRKHATDAMMAAVEKQAFAKTDTQKQMPDPSAAPGSQTPPPLPMLFRVKMPGKITETNGLLDPATNEVVWPLYSSSPAEGDIELTATCKTR